MTKSRKFIYLFTVEISENKYREMIRQIKKRRKTIDVVKKLAQTLVSLNSR